jgi:hypothetical protein
MKKGVGSGEWGVGNREWGKEVTSFSMAMAWSVIVLCFN